MMSITPGRAGILLMKGLVRFAILSLLEKREMTGYSILKNLRSLTGLNLHAGSVYPLLYSLEKSGLLTSFSIEKGRRRLRYYKLSEAGRELLGKTKHIAQKIFEGEHRA
ncbi:MAG: hypothetical protein DRJ31_07245 [Candidatus Methanomethylicota archaeon]|uniref:Transcription regulator PadR N-terminal domain-containing protein n=1 Tax=Thermoproteota archaeon TaxID=2056631 RepID=A0A497EMR0_9CREN|nr:MAG: hypothetical protein DRJ31_07245 [Candidatus Verstraetearchaeota archaeon]